MVAFALAGSSAAWRFDENDSCGAVPCHSDADCERGAAPTGCTWCRSPAPGKKNNQTCGGPPSPTDCGVLPGQAKHPDQPQYLCLGDSVSKGIFSKLGKMLQAEPYSYETFHSASHDGGGCGNTVRGRDCIDFWTEGQNLTLGRNWDVVSYNFGLHDLANDSEHVDVDVYADNLRNITQRLLRHTPGLKQLYWISSTPVPNVPLAPPRAQADVPLYNAAALKVLQEEKFKDRVKVIDLYAFVVKQCGGDPHYTSCAPFQHTTDVHFSSEGYVAMAQYIFDSVTGNSTNGTSLY